MPASEARIEANRANAQRSKGPTTEAGKCRSRANALKHGLCSRVVGLETAEVRVAVGQGGAISGFDGWLAQQVASLSLRVEHAQAMQTAARNRLALRAELAWEDDRRYEAVCLGERISARPVQVVERLLQTPQGCEWMMARWALLAHAADQGQGWTPDQKSAAFDLLGTPLEFREGVEPGTTIDATGQALGPVSKLAALARHEIATLRTRVEHARKLDSADRQLAQAGLSDDPDLRRLRRYEQALQRQLRWSLEMLQTASRPTTINSPQPEPAVTEPDPKPEPEPETVEPESASTTQAVTPPIRSTSSRVEKKLMKAESRRDSRRRKLERLLA